MTVEMRKAGDDRAEQLRAAAFEHPQGGQELVGRGSLVESVVALMAKDDPSPEERRMTLHGVSGIGKTAVAVAVMKKLEVSKPEWRFVWLRGSTLEELQQGLVHFARAVLRAVQPGDKLETTLHKLKAWLSGNSSTTVLAVDDATEETLQYLESVLLGGPCQGHVLMTASTPLSQSSWELTPLDVEDSLALVKSKFRQQHAPDVDVGFLFSEGDGNEERLKGFLSGGLVDNLPLAVEKVAWVMIARAEDASSLMRSKGLLDERCRGVLTAAVEDITEAASAMDDGTSSTDTQGGMRGLMGAVRLWIERLRRLPDKELREASLSLLHACALMPEQGIPWSLLQAFSCMRQSAPGTESRGSSSSSSSGAEGTCGTNKDAVLEQTVQDLSLNCAKGSCHQLTSDEAGEDPSSASVGRSATPRAPRSTEEGVSGGGGPEEAEGASNDREQQKASASASLMERALETLEAFGRLVVVRGSCSSCDVDGDGRSTSMHGAVQACIRQELGTSCPQGLREALSSRFDGGRMDPAEWKEMERWWPCVASFLSRCSEPPRTEETQGEQSSRAAAILDARLRASAGLLLVDQGLWHQAEPHLQQAARDRREHLQERHPETLSSIYSLGLLYKAMERGNEAETHLVEAVEGRRAELGGRHLDTISSINSLASLYQGQGRYDDAEPLFVEALQGMKGELGARHQDTLNGLSNLAGLYMNQKRYREAEPLLVEALRGRMAELGQRHPHTLSSINNLAGLHMRQGRYNEAERLFNEALLRRRAEMGERHPDTLSSVVNLASLYDSQGRHSKAEPLYLEALEGRRAELGERHRDTIDSLSSLASLYQGQQRYGEAEPLFVEALEAMRATLGGRHLETLTSSNNLGHLFWSQERYAEAEPLFLEALEGRRKMLRERHPDTLISINNLGLLYVSQKRYSEAEPLYREALEGMKVELGERHQDTLVSIHNLALLYIEKKNFFAGAELLHEGLKTIFTHWCGESFAEDWKRMLKICKEAIARAGPKEKCPCGSGRRRQKCHPQA